jgi:hypothetical protein
MALDPEERKIAALFAAFEDINARVDGTVGRLERAVGQLDPTVRQAVRDTYAKELVGLAEQIKKTTASLEGLRRSADWRQLLLGAGLSVLVVLVTLGGFWLFTPSATEMSRLRAEEQQLQASIDLLASHGGRAELKKCGASSEHLCVRVEPGLGRFGEGKDYFVIRGY